MVFSFWCFDWRFFSSLVGMLRVPFIGKSASLVGILKKWRGLSLRAMGGLVELVRFKI